MNTSKTRGVASGKTGPAWGDTALSRTLQASLSYLQEAARQKAEPVAAWLPASELPTDDELAAVHRRLADLCALPLAMPECDDLDPIPECMK